MRSGRLLTVLTAALGAVAGALIAAFALGTGTAGTFLGAAAGALVAVIDLFILSKFLKSRRDAE
ncbi:hypothetical protein BCF33_1160 [Hasllibacter halocynthiae]|uniref:Uncharacterized protein n=1 Tax=Hasllibacter halocynthiae TaxID=595589 RepID=A0A2T0X9D3_9RHOB|nr:hypothetical protein [Hasllibacter halocynthiae]PRY95539.1 hypothetical protein BCF33_1160 [Hasllibacter halocynthiae]